MGLWRPKPMSRLGMPPTLSSTRSRRSPRWLEMPPRRPSRRISRRQNRGDHHGRPLYFLFKKCIIIYVQNHEIGGKMTEEERVEHRKMLVEKRDQLCEEVVKKLVSIRRDGILVGAESAGGDTADVASQDQGNDADLVY